MIVEIIPGRYIEVGTLGEYLKSKFGADKFHVHVGG